MTFKILWPGKTRNREVRSLEELYIRKINRLGTCELIETKTAKGIPERFGERIKEIEAEELEKHIQDGYIICLFDKGREMSSEEFARFLDRLTLSSTRVVTFIVGGFLGLSERIINRADFLLSLSG